MGTKIRFLALVLTALLLAAGTAYAAGPAPAGSATTSEADEEVEVVEEVEEEEGDPAAECAEAQAEFAAGEIEPEEVEAFCEEAEGPNAAGLSSQARKCPLRSAHAHSATSHNTLKVTLGYTAYKPFQAKLRLSSHLGTIKRHLSRTGTVRFTKALGSRSPGKLILRLRTMGVRGCPSRRLVLFPK